MENILFTNIRALTGPGVYLYYQGDLIVYIGATSVGLSRVFAAHAGVSLSQLSQVKFLPCTSTEDAFRLEAQLIQEHNPPLNLKHTTHKVSYARLRDRKRHGVLTEEQVARIQRQEYGHPFHPNHILTGE